MMRDWLVEKKDPIQGRWGAEIRIREARVEGEQEGLLDLFLGTLVGCLPALLGNGNQGQEVWQQATRLYGSWALRRGLAAGEVVEEVQLLREAILRLLLEDPPGDWSDPKFHRDVISLNQILDRGVAQASVAYADDLFFSHLQGSGVPEAITPELEEELESQLESFRGELAE